MSHRTLSLPLLLATAVVISACSDASTQPRTESLAGTASLSGSGGAVNGSRVAVEIALTPAAGPAHGKAKFQTRDNQRELEIEIEDVKPGISIAFFLGDNQVGATQTADAFGSARVELNTRLGDPVPASVSGLRVTARSGDALIVSGMFK